MFLRGVQQVCVGPQGRLAADGAFAVDEAQGGFADRLQVMQGGGQVGAGAGETRPLWAQLRGTRPRWVPVRSAPAMVSRTPAMMGCAAASVVVVAASVAVVAASVAGVLGRRCRRRGGTAGERQQ